MLWRAWLVQILILSAAGAQEQRALARDKFQEGRVEFAAQHYEKALALFEEAYRLAPFPDLLFNIGRCEQQLGHYRAALAAYEQFLAVHPSDPEVQERAAEMRRRAVEEPLPLPPEPSPSPQAANLPPPPPPSAP